MSKPWTLCWIRSLKAVTTALPKKEKDELFKLSQKK